MESSFVTAVPSLGHGSVIVVCVLVLVLFVSIPSRDRLAALRLVVRAVSGR